MALSREEVQKFHKEGYLLVDNFLTGEECDYLKTRALEIVRKADFDQHPLVTFGTTSTESEHTKTDYFINSGNKIRFFFEEGAVDSHGKLTVEPGQALNKIGHALHALDPDFKEVTFSNNVKEVAKSLNLKNPCVVQSMVIFKPPKLGGVVNPHQDSTFLYTSPMNLVGFWIALEDADEGNGCMWFSPGSHKHGIVGRLKRKSVDGSIGTTYEGSLPEVADYVAVPVKREASLSSTEKSYTRVVRTIPVARETYILFIYMMLVLRCGVRRTGYSPQKICLFHSYTPSKKLYCVLWYATIGSTGKLASSPGSQEAGSRRWSSSHI